MKEEELAKHFVDFFSDHDVYQEVPAGGIIDIVAVNGIILTAIEVKTSLNIDVIEQAVRNKIYAHYSYVAVPEPKRRFFGFATRICENYGIGILSWNGLRVNEHCRPKLNRSIHKIILADWQKRSNAGCQTGRMTAFKATIEEIEQKLKWHKGKYPIRDTFKEIGHHYSGISSAQSSVCNMIRQGIITSFTYEKGFFILKDTP